MERALRSGHRSGALVGRAVSRPELRARLPPELLLVSSKVAGTRAFLRRDDVAPRAIRARAGEALQSVDEQGLTSAYMYVSSLRV